jgi:hypothetical protein
MGFRQEGCHRVSPEGRFRSVYSCCFGLFSGGIAGNGSEVTATI